LDYDHFFAPVHDFRVQPGYREIDPIVTLPDLEFTPGYRRSGDFGDIYSVMSFGDNQLLRMTSVSRQSERIINLREGCAVDLNPAYHNFISDPANQAMMVQRVVQGAFGRGDFLLWYAGSVEPQVITFGELSASRGNITHSSSDIPYGRDAEDILVINDQGHKGYNLVELKERHRAGIPPLDIFSTADGTRSFDGTFFPSVLAEWQLRQTFYRQVTDPARIFHLKWSAVRLVAATEGSKAYKY